MGKIIGLDVGTVRVGCAVADEAIKIPFPHAVWPRAQGAAERKIISLINELGCKAIIIGAPLDTDGNLTPACQQVEQFVRRLSKRSPVKIIYVDESHSSLEAEERREGMGNQGSEPVDAAAACVILERYFSEI